MVKSSIRLLSGGCSRRNVSADPFLRTRLYDFVQSRLQTLSLCTGLSISKPTFVCIKLTMRCNARCQHCPIGNPRRADPEEIWNRRRRCWMAP